MSFEINENLATLRGKIPGVHMDTKGGGGIHLWVNGDVAQFPDGSKSISVHLTREEAVLLAKEILYRILREFEDRVNQTLRQNF